MRGGKADDSCVGRCGIAGTDLTKPCQCNPSCQTYNDCCADFIATCNTCDGRCTAGYDTKWPCQCNADCSTYNNCCPDKPDLCGGTGKTQLKPYIIWLQRICSNSFEIWQEVEPSLMRSLRLFLSSFTLMTSMLCRESFWTCNRQRHLVAPQTKLHCR
jgi:hypothetical protein